MSERPERQAVLVTGASGSLGACLLPHLARAGYEVLALDRCPPVSQVPSPWHHLDLDLLSPGAAAVLDKLFPRLVVHCAAVIPDSFQDHTADRAGEINRSLDDTVIELCRRTSAKLVFISSIAVYGAAPSPWREDSPTYPGDAYSRQKLVTERLSAQLLGEGTTSLRISAPYGMGLRHRKVMEIFLRRALAGQDLIYHGSGRRTQTFVALDDICGAILAALKRPHVGGVFNVSGAGAISMKRLAELAVKVTGSQSRVVASGQKDSGEDYRAAVEIQKIGRELAWQPAIELEDGMRRWAELLRTENS